MSTNSACPIWHLHCVRNNGKKSHQSMHLNTCCPTMGDSWRRSLKSMTHIPPKGFAFPCNRLKVLKMKINISAETNEISSINKTWYPFISMSSSLWNVCVKEAYHRQLEESESPFNLGQHDSNDPLIEHHYNHWPIAATNFKWWGANSWTIDNDALTLE